MNVFGFQEPCDSLCSWALLSFPIHVYSPGHEFTARTVIELAAHDYFHWPRKTFRFAISPCLTAAAVFLGHLDRGGTFGRIGSRSNIPLVSAAWTEKNGTPRSNPNSPLSSRVALKIYYRSHTDRAHRTCMEITSVLHELRWSKHTFVSHASQIPSQQRTMSRNITNWNVIESNFFQRII